MILTNAASPGRSGSTAVLFALLVALGCSPAAGGGGDASGGAPPGTGSTAGSGSGGSPTGGGGSSSGGQTGTGGETATDPAIWINSRGKVETGSNTFGI